MAITSTIVGAMIVLLWASPTMRGMLGSALGGVAGVFVWGYLWLTGPVAMTRWGVGVLGVGAAGLVLLLATRYIAANSWKQYRSDRFDGRILNTVAEGPPVLVWSWEWSGRSAVNLTPHCPVNGCERKVEWQPSLPGRSSLFCPYCQSRVTFGMRREQVLERVEEEIARRVDTREWRAARLRAHPEKEGESTGQLKAATPVSQEVATAVAPKPQVRPSGLRGRYPMPSGTPYLTPQRKESLAIDEDSGSLEAVVHNCLRNGQRRSEEELKKRRLSLPEHGAWEVACVVDGKIPPHSANRDFLNLLNRSYPKFSGWPTWEDPRGAEDPKSEPYVFNEAWEALIVSTGGEVGRTLDFWRLDPTGKFFLHRALQDDISGSPDMPEPLTALDFGLTALWTADAMAVALGLAEAMGCPFESTSLGFVFRWTRLEGRQFCPWSGTAVPILRGQTAHQDELITPIIVVPLNTPHLEIAEFVYHATAPLVRLFGGYEVSRTIIKALLERRR